SAHGLRVGSRLAAVPRDHGHHRHPVRRLQTPRPLRGGGEVTTAARLAGLPQPATDAAVTADLAPRRRKRGLAKRVTIAVLLTLFGVLFLYPFVWLVSASLKPRSEVFDNAIIPNTFTFENYINVWQEAPLALWLGNTAVVTVLA